MLKKLRDLHSLARTKVHLGLAKRGFAPYAESLRAQYRERTLEDPQSQLATYAQIYSPTYDLWSSRLRLRPIRHRKYWEYAFIMQALERRELLRPGCRGLGFGVGKEPLAAYMAKLGCDVVATDLPQERAKELGWTSTNEHAASFAELDSFGVCDLETLQKHVTFRAVDMNDVPRDLVDFDFTWSSCAFEHLGSIAQGLAFVERSVETLRPGGVAVHTTEFNVSSDTETHESSDTVLFRKRDFEDLIKRLTARGHHVAELSLHPGSTPPDEHVDVPPY